MISQQFNDQLNQFKIELKEDSLEYICNKPDDMMLTNHDEVRESTKVFLVGASINDMARNDFYQALFSSNDFKGKAFTSTASSGPGLTNNKKDSQMSNKIYGMILLHIRSGI